MQLGESFARYRRLMRRAGPLDRVVCDDPRAFSALGEERNALGSGHARAGCAENAQMVPPREQFAQGGVILPMNPMEIEDQYQEIMADLEGWTPEGIVHVDLEYLQSLGLLSETDGEFGQPKHPLTHYFHVIETTEKITLFNDQFVVWIVPQIFDHEPVTFALVGILTAEGVHLELVFATSGVYNTSKIVLKVLERLLEEIQENEDILDNLS